MAIINERIAALWDTHFPDNHEVYAPLLYENLKKDSLLFVGLNPSFSETGISRFLRGSAYEQIVPKEFFRWNKMRVDPEQIAACAAIDRTAHSTYDNYFGILRDIAAKIEQPWEHIDLFLYRQTRQSDFEARIFEKRRLTTFAKDQLELFKDIVAEIQPKVVVVNNALGSKIIKEYFQGDLVWNEDGGFYLISIAGKSTPIFFSSMLSGQRSLDVHSRERLVWHLKQACSFQRA